MVVVLVVVLLLRLALQPLAFVLQLAGPCSPQCSSLPACTVHLSFACLLFVLLLLLPVPLLVYPPSIVHSLFVVVVRHLAFGVVSACWPMFLCFAQALVGVCISCIVSMHIIINLLDRTLLDLLLVGTPPGSSALLASSVLSPSYPSTIWQPFWPH